MDKTSVTTEIDGVKLTLQTGELAKQATSSVLARLGDTMVLVTMVAGKEREDIDYFPLTVEYVERLYAGGRIKGSRWVKREGRPTDEAILTARLIDRSIRPLFPKDYRKEVQIVVTVLSVDGENEPDILSIIATSAALSISQVPWNGPVSAIRMGYVLEKGNGNKEFLVNPSPAELDLSELDLVATQTREKTLMLEARAVQAPEDVVIEAIGKANAENKKIIALIEDFAKKIGTKKETVTPNTALLEIIAIVQKSYKAEVETLIAGRLSKESSGLGPEDLISKIYDDEKARNPEENIDKKNIAKAIEYVMFKLIRKDVLEKLRKIRQEPAFKQKIRAKMLSKHDEKNIMNEILNKHIILYGAELFYRLIERGRL